MYKYIYFLFISIGFSSILRIPDEYATIQEGINAASNGDTVLVSDGTYSGIGNVNLTWDSNGSTSFGADGYVRDCLKEMIVDAPWGITTESLLMSFDE